MKAMNDEALEHLRVSPGDGANLAGRDPGWDGDESIPRKKRKKAGRKLLADGIERLRAAQERLWAADSWSLLVIFQALDAAGKDSTIKHVFSGVNPQGCHVASFKKPSARELDHDFLWRCVRELPSRGRIGIFNRSYYEEVLVVRVHPELLDHQKLPPGVTRGGPELWAERYESINDFERHLARNGTRVVKFFLHVSPQEQRERFLDRLRRPDKHWKFSTSDLAERAHWDDYMAAYEAALSATSTQEAPWYVVPADHKWVTRARVVEILCHEIEALGPAFPTVDADERRRLAEARTVLEGEG